LHSGVPLNPRVNRSSAKKAFTGWRTRQHIGQEVVMKAKDLMTQPVISVAADAPVLEAVRIMLQKKISGLPVLDASGQLAGIVTEGDFLRRIETGTLRRRPRWIEFFVGQGRLADEYVQASGRRVGEIMTPDVHTVAEDSSLEDVVRLMERHGIKRVPVVRGQELVGIVTRENIMRALARTAIQAPTLSTSDSAIRERLLTHLGEQPWAPLDSIDVAVSDGIVTLSGVLTDERQRQALCVAAQNIAGVKKVEDRLAPVMSGTTMRS
jgi:CBS domain-containing protein